MGWGGVWRRWGGLLVIITRLTDTHCECHLSDVMSWRRHGGWWMDERESDGGIRGGVRDRMSKGGALHKKRWCTIKLSVDLHPPQRWQCGRHICLQVGLWSSDINNKKKKQLHYLLCGKYRLDYFRLFCFVYKWSCIITILQ